uniref:LIM zinc-binding domain-containing protein n=1 Tax=Kalanchoe fedtschenkoi TaxID=63787 RepID=A0A7N1A263_KALFE
MSFSGTQQKCNACDKTVHFIDMMSADGVIYHKSCFRCSHCNGLLVVSSYSSMDGVLYCRPHFEQLFKETGNFSQKFSSGKPPERPNELGRTPSKLSAMFGTQDKCSVCMKTVYALEKVTVEGEFYHKGCFRCSHGGCNLNPSSYAALDGILYCKPHFSQLFREKGSYTHLTETASLKKNAAEAATAAAAEEEEAPADTEPASEPDHPPDETKPAAEE